MNKQSLIAITILILLSACQYIKKKTTTDNLAIDSVKVVNFISMGDSIYAQKASFNNFSMSMELYDSAWQVASKTNDTNLIARAVFAKGRAYDAINNNPQKTIDYYIEASQLYAAIPEQQTKAMYIKHLVAHSYDKVQDSGNCIKILKELYNQILHKPDSIKKELRFTVEMALTSTVVKNYNFADSILKYLTKEEWITNISTEYDYLNHYYLTKAKINVMQYRNYKSNFIDSVEYLFTRSRNLSDSIYYSNELWELYKTTGNTTKEVFYLKLNNALYNKFNSPKVVKEVKDKLEKMDMAILEAQRKAAMEKELIRKKYFYALSALFVVISILTIFLINRIKAIKRKQKEMILKNEELAQKNVQNELLNKEIHHRVKNNLQMIMSLVYMQERNSNTEEVKENMQNIRLRIESISELHQQLMELTNEADLKKYIQHLVASVSNLLADDKQIITHLEIQSLNVSHKIYFPLGLIINEWITNSVKYASPANNPLTITIEIHKGHNEIIVKYKDNGKTSIGKSIKKTLGLEIINLLVAQLDATLKTETNNIFNYHLIIPFNYGE